MDDVDATPSDRHVAWAVGGARGRAPFERGPDVREARADRWENEPTLPGLDDAAAATVSLEDALVVILEGDRPAAGSLRAPLAGIDRVTIGRAATRCIVVASGQARLGVPDRWMSSRHAELVRGARGWTICDLGSRNGSAVNGAPTAQAQLQPGDLIELGHTMFRFTRDPEIARGVEPMRVAGSAEPLTYHPGLAQAVSLIYRLAPSTVPVMLHGETGTGKEVLARALHAASGRTGPFIALNCGALTPSLAEAELFGFRRGSFTGATEDRDGVIRAAQGGTLLLDEIAELSPTAQASLLRVLQEFEVVPIGGTRPVPVDVRIVTATHQQLDDRVARGLFRDDLLARLRGFEVTIPPLRERRMDLGLLCAALLRRIAPASADTLRFAPSMVRALYAYAWPHNVRELEKALEMAVALARHGEVRLEHLPSHIRDNGATKASARKPRISPQDSALRDRMSALLTRHRGNLAAAARAEGKAVVQIRRWLTRCDLDANEFR